MVISDPPHTECSQLQDEHNIYGIMKTMCPRVNHESNVFVATHALRNIMYTLCGGSHMKYF